MKPDRRFSDTLYRIVFTAAGVYNFLFGAWAVFVPHAFFDVMEMARPIYPELWQLLGMVIGLYGIVYIWSALHLEHGRIFILIGLLGKVLGPIGWGTLVYAGDWPFHTYTMILFNDLIWWIPFGLFLVRSSRFRRICHSFWPWLAAGFTAIASIYSGWVIRPGTEVEGSPEQRLAFIRDHLLLWRTGWGLWGLAGVSLVGFYVWWGHRLDGNRWALSGVLVGATGVCMDLLGGSMYIGWVPEMFHQLHRPATYLTAGAGNLLYSAGGLLLTLGTSFRRFWLKAWAWCIWGIGFVFSAAAFLGLSRLLEVTAVLTMVLFVLWVPLFVFRSRL